jgi:AcrR family transcriptional regulator
MPANRIAPGRARLSSTERRGEIVRAVLTLAREHGPDAITTQAIADRIGVTQGALFRHFPDKSAIWLAVFEWVRGALVAGFEAAIRDTASPLGRLERAFLAHVAFVAAHPGVPRALFHELQYTGDSPVRIAVRSMVGDYRRRVGRLLEDAKASGEIRREVDTALATVLFIGAVQGLVIHAALTDEGALARNGRAMFALLLDGYRGAHAPRRTRKSRALRR